MNNRTHSPTHELLTAGGSFVFVQMDQPTIADYPVGVAASTPTYRYVYASYIDEPVVRKTASTGGTRVYFHRNQQFSITSITTSAGAVTERYAYTAYGQPTILNASGTVLTSSAVGNRYTYTGREWDETLGLHHFRARWMSPLAGRFLGRDPIGYIDGPQLYKAFFVVSGMDPSGHYAVQPREVEVPQVDVDVDLDIEDGPDDGDVARCQDVCANLYPHWYQYHLFVGCIVGCDPGPVVDGQIDNVDTVICFTFVVCDVITVPSGEGAAGCLASKTACRQVKKCIKNKLRKPKSPNAKRTLECEALHIAYHDAEKGGASCTGAMACPELLANESMALVVLALRQRFLDKRCDWYLAGSIAKGSAKAEAEHKAEIANRAAAAANCAAIIAQKKCL